MKRLKNKIVQEKSSGVFFIRMIVRELKGILYF